MEVVDVVEQERQVKQLQLGHEAGELGEARSGDLDGVHGDGFDGVAVVVQRSVGVDLDLDLALGALFDEFLEILGGLTLGRVDGYDVAELDDHRLGEYRSGRQQQDHQSDQKT